MLADPEQSLRLGRLDEAREGLEGRIRAAPGDARLRTFLFQLLAVTGDWERALAQLQVAGELDASALPMVQTYREAIRCEALRAEIFAGRATPLVLGRPLRWLALLMEALRLEARDAPGPAGDLRNEAFDTAPASPGGIDGNRFAWIADADRRLGPVVEAIVDGKYYWVPFEQLREVRFEPPADLRDLVWTPAYFTWTNGGQSVGLIPTRYPGSEADPDAGIRLGRRTQWVEVEGAPPRGLGQRAWITDREGYALMDVRHLVLDPVPAVGDDGGAER